MVAETSHLPDVWNQVITASVAIGTGIAAVWAYFRKPKEKTSGQEVAIVSATLFSDKSTIESLIQAISQNTDCLMELRELMHTDIQRRRDEQIIRAALAAHGIKEQGQ